MPTAVSSMAAARERHRLGNHPRLIRGTRTFCAVAVGTRNWLRSTPVVRCRFSNARCTVVGSTFLAWNFLGFGTFLGWTHVSRLDLKIVPDDGIVVIPQMKPSIVPRHTTSQAGRVELRFNISFVGSPHSSGDWAFTATCGLQPWPLIATFHVGGRSSRKIGYAGRLSANSGFDANIRRCGARWTRGAWRETKRQLCSTGACVRKDCARSRSSALCNSV
jgi:hypothetical protein